MAGIIILFAFGCEKSQTTDNSIDDPLKGTNPAPTIQQNTANLNITLAADYSLKTTSYDQVNLDIQQISFHTSGDTISGDTTVLAGWFDLETVPGIYNLMDYVSTDTLVAFDSLVNAQMISQIRLLLGDSNTVMVDSVLHNLITPSAQTSGIKVQVHTLMVPDSTYVIMLDFDPEASVMQVGNGNYKLQPVIQAIVNP